MCKVLFKDIKGIKLVFNNLLCDINGRRTYFQPIELPFKLPSVSVCLAVKRSTVIYKTIDHCCCVDIWKTV